MILGQKKRGFHLLFYNIKFINAEIPLFNSANKVDVTTDVLITIAVFFIISFLVGNEILLNSPLIDLSMEKSSLFHLFDIYSLLHFCLNHFSSI